MQNGFIILGFGCLINGILKLSLAECIKYYAKKILSNWQPRSAAGLGIDVYITVKWLVLILILYIGSSNYFSLFLICYFLFFDLFNYFYFHSWGTESQYSKLTDKEQFLRERRRFVTFLLAVLYSIFGFSTIYFLFIPSELCWPSEPNLIDAVLLSVSNSFTLTYDGFSPDSQIGRSVLVSQVLSMFMFLTVLISNSVPDLRYYRK